MPRSSGASRAARASVARKPGSTTVSLLSVSTHVPWATAMPRLQPSAKPRLSGKETSTASGHASRVTASESSSLPLSTKTNSTSFVAWGRRAVRQRRSVSAAFQFTMTMESQGVIVG